MVTGIERWKEYFRDYKDKCLTERQKVSEK